MLFKSRERQVHERICQEIESRLTRSGAPREVRHFLLNHWSYLLAGVFFSHGDQHPDWEAGWHTVNALLWSLTPKQGQEETEQFLRLVPTLLGRLHDGCDAMNLAPAERDELFSQLALLHAAVARAGLEAALAPDGPITQLGRDADLEFSEAEIASLEASSVSEATDSRRSKEDLAAAIAALQVGDSVRFRIADREKPLFLQWISPMGGMYLFADEEGYDAMSLTSARLAEKLAKGEASLGK
ncbi:DUF1631 family protein [Parasulfuritortus cantonensis]|uniref:DUF1631 family protein n=1 Tax=Parasulfuritortus cantonensis TaxID=2528202 RepID=A0A4R1BGH7_9PROT|nr:DUF1631 family protein [Parasulfuritortus cantonensis]TCJ16335.1 DUF1631 family protein [Parasulfuritortus cantonensis]